jgi:signal transduction histidine kinase
MMPATPPEDLIFFYSRAAPVAGTRWEGPVLSPGMQAQALLEPFNRSLALAAGAGAGVALVLTAVLSRRNALSNSVSVSEQLRRHMVSDIAHELRTPLTNIRGYLEAIRDGVLTPQPAVVDSLYEETMLLNRLVEDLQDLALVEAGQLRLERQPIAVADVIEKTVAAMQSRASEAGPSLATEIPADLPQVQADPERVGQVLRNLLSNALHHTPPEGHIGVCARSVPEGVEVAVADTGTGIPPEQAPYVFERFYRADPSRDRATGGAGLGLAIVKQLVEAHGGRVWLESEPGHGTTVHFTLPRSP